MGGGEGKWTMNQKFEYLKIGESNFNQILKKWRRFKSQKIEFRSYVGYLAQFELSFQKMKQITCPDIVKVSPQKLICPLFST